MNSPSAIYNRRPSIRGDTLLGWSVDVSIDGEPAQLESARLHLCTNAGRVVYAWPAVVVGNRITLSDVPADVTAAWPIGVLEYDLEIVLAGGRTVTWLTGVQPVLADRTR